MTKNRQLTRLITRLATRLTVAALVIALGACSEKKSPPSATKPAQADDPGQTQTKKKTKPQKTPAKDSATPSAQANNPGDPSSKNSATAMIALYNDWVAAYEAKDWDKSASFFADDATFQTGNNPQKIVGGAAINKTLQSVAAGFPDMENHTLIVLAKDGWLVDVTLSRGTNSGSMMGQPATDKRTSFVALQIWRVNKDGKIQSVVAHADNLNFLGHLGMFAGEVRPVDESKPPAKVEVVDAPANPANETIVKNLVAGIAAHDPAAVAALYDGHAVLDDVSAPASVEKSLAIRDYWHALFTLFPDVKYTDVEIDSIGDYVVMSYNFEGTNRGDVPRFSAKATGKSLKMVAADMFKIANGRIVRHDIFVDGMSVGVMLGLMKF